MILIIGSLDVWFSLCLSTSTAARNEYNDSNTRKSATWTTTFTPQTLEKHTWTILGAIYSSSFCSSGKKQEPWPCRFPAAFCVLYSLLMQRIVSLGENSEGVNADAVVSRTVVRRCRVMVAFLRGVSPKVGHRYKRLTAGRDTYYGTVSSCVDYGGGWGGKTEKLPRGERA